MKTVKTFLCISIVGALGMMSCKKDFDNPNGVLIQPALSTPSGITAVAAGLQRNFSTTRVGTLYNMVTANGFVTNELSLRNAGNVDEANLSYGGTFIDGSNNVLGNLWATNLKVIFDANRVIAAASGLGDKNYAAGVIGYATIWKALAQGSLAMYWEKVPDTVGVGLTVNFIDRIQGFEKALANINHALVLITDNAPSATVLGSLPSGVDIPNTLNAIKARYLLFTGKYPEALAAANLVNLSAKSEMRFESLNQNPIFETSTSTNNVWQVVDSTFGLPPALAPDLADKRIPFYMSINPTIAPRWRINGFGATLSTPWPIYVPGEITLIKAEAYARLPVPDLASAIVEINKIRTKQPASDPFGIGAGLGPYTGPVTQADVLTEIYRNRAIELHMQGFKLEDMRRFGRPASERKRNFMPYPFRERDNNPNTPADPAF
jgi:hypothetical protein